MEYIRSKKQAEKQCVFCTKSKEKENDQENLVLFRGNGAFVLMNLYPYNNGHLMITPYEHTDTLESLSQNCMSEIMYLTNQSMKIIQSILN